MNQLIELLDKVEILCNESKIEKNNSDDETDFVSRIDKRRSLILHFKVNRKEHEYLQRIIPSGMTLSGFVRQKLGL